MTVGNTYTDLHQLTQPTQNELRTVNGASGVVQEGDTSGFQPADKMGKDDFLNLLVTQLRYQDPMNPTADTAFVAQLAQFSSLENSETMEKAIVGLSDNMNNFMANQTLASMSQTNASSVSLLGKDVRVKETSARWEGAEREFSVNLASGTRGVLALMNAEGKVVAEIPFETPANSKETTLTWDGMLADGSQAGSGNTFQVAVMDSTGSRVNGYAYINGRVEGIRYADNGARIVVDGAEYEVSKLVAVEEV